MKRLFAITLFLSLLSAVGAQKASEASAPEKTRVLIILDCSKSMWDKWQSDSKIKVTQQVLLQMVDSIAARPGLEVALRVFGHLNNDSYSTRLEVPFAPDNRYRLQSKIKTLVPNGTSAAAAALSSSLNDFPNEEGVRNIILVVTDGVGDSDGTICDVARQVQVSGVVVTTFVLGIGNAADSRLALGCAGRYTAVADEEHLDDALRQVFQLTRQKGKLTIRMVDGDGQPYETDTPIVFYDRQAHATRYTTVHSYRADAVQDTLTIDPLTTYDVTVFTKPPIYLTGRQFSAEPSATLEIKADQGGLRLHHDGAPSSWALPQYLVEVRRHGERDLFATQLMGERVDYLSGSYDIDVLSAPPMHLEGVSLLGSGALTDLAIPMPGQLALSKPKTATVGSIFSVQRGKMSWVCDLDSALQTERVVLMPGEYMLVLKPKDGVEYLSSRTARFSIKSGRQTGVEIN